MAQFMTAKSGAMLNLPGRSDREPFLHPFMSLLLGHSSASRPEKGPLSFGPRVTRRRSIFAKGQNVIDLFSDFPVMTMIPPLLSRGAHHQTKQKLAW